MQVLRATSDDLNFWLHRARATDDRAILRAWSEKLADVIS
uniref:Uncharacterized protein n=1 Tax=Arundo donax TaxID=35708 RepID=A0A0A9BL01_ARUDO